MEGKYASLQEEAAARNSKLKEVWKEFQRAREEVRLCVCANFATKLVKIFLILLQNSSLFFPINFHC